jgi:hypothetical protein
MKKLRRFISRVAGSLSTLKPIFLIWLAKSFKTYAFKMVSKTILKTIIKSTIGGWLFTYALNALLEEGEPYIEAFFRKIKKIKRVEEGKVILEELGDANESGNVDDWRDTANKL